MSVPLSPSMPGNQKGAPNPGHLAKVRLPDNVYPAIAIIVSLIFLINVAGAYLWQREALANLLHSHADRARIIANSIESEIQRVQQMELTLGSSLFHYQSREDALTAFNEALTADQTVKGLAWLNRQGAVLASTESKTSFAVPVADLDQHLQKGEVFFINSTLKVDKENPILLLYAFPPSKNPLGFLVAELDVWTIVEDTLQRHHSQAQVQILGENEKPLFQQIPANSPLDCLNLQQTQSWVGHENSSLLSDSVLPTPDRVCAVATVPVPLVNWTVKVAGSGSPRIAFAPVRILWAAALVVGAFFLFLMNSVRQYRKRVQILQKTALQISQGNFTARALLSGDDDIAATAAILNHMAERIEDLENSRNRFLQIAAHELRNPMAGIKGMLSLWRYRLNKQKIIEDPLQQITLMEREVDRLSSLLKEILDAYQLQEDHLQLERNRIDLAQVVQVALAPFQAAEDAARISLDAEFPEEVWINGDARRLEEVFRNLISNALKYSPTDRPVSVSLLTQKPRVLFSVTDQGIGIPEGQLEQVFDGFYRSSNLKGRDPGGLGLGLFICKDIILRHGGRIWAESKEGEGSTFYVSLPLAQDEESEAKEAK